MNLFPLFTSNSSFPMTAFVQLLLIKFYVLVFSPHPYPIRYVSSALCCWWRKASSSREKKSLFYLFFGHKACGILVPCPGIHLAPLHWKHRVLTTGPPGKSLSVCDGGLQPYFVSPVPEMVVWQVLSSAQMSLFHKNFPCWFWCAHGVKNHLSSEGQSSHKFYLWRFFEICFWWVLYERAVSLSVLWRRAWT